MHRTLAALLFLTLFGCCCIGPAALPGPTRREVQMSDIAGEWRYYADYGQTTITLALMEDETFVQTIERSGEEPVQVHTGEWGLDGAWLKLSVLKPIPGNPSAPWIEEEANWWVVDSYQDGIDFAVFGAADDRDPDNCNEFERIR
jgi:hypothetical protein